MENRAYQNQFIESYTMVSKRELDIMRIKRPNRDNFIITLFQSFNINAVLGAFLATGANAIYALSFQDLLSKDDVTAKFCIGVMLTSFIVGLLAHLTANLACKR